MINTTDYNHIFEKNIILHSFLKLTVRILMMHNFLIIELQKKALKIFD